MKTLRFLGMALIAILVSVSFSACSSSDDDDDNGGGGLVTTIEGTWYLKSERWYAWKDGQPDMHNIKMQQSYDDYAKERIWVLKKDGENLLLEQTMTEKGKRETNKYTLEKIGNNEYKKGNDRVVIKSISEKQLVVDYYDGYYSDYDDDAKEYGIYTFMR